MGTLPYFPPERSRESSEGVRKGHPAFSNSFIRHPQLDHPGAWGLENHNEKSYGKIEYVAWERLWKAKVEELLLVYQKDQTKSFLSMDHLCGEDNFKKTQNQTDVIPAEVLGDIRLLLLYFKCPNPGSPPPTMHSLNKSLERTSVNSSKDYRWQLSGGWTMR